MCALPIFLLIDAVKFHQLDVVAIRHRTSDAVEQAFCDGAAQIIALRLHGLVPAQPIKWLRNITATVDYSVHINPLISKRRAGSDDPPGGCGHSPPLLPAPCVIPMQTHKSAPPPHPAQAWSSEEHTSELQSLMRISY